MANLSMDVWSYLQTNKQGDVSVASKGENKGKNVPMARLRVKVSEGELSDIFTMEAFTNMFHSEGSEYCVNNEFTPEKGKNKGKLTPARYAKFSSNGSDEMIQVRRGDGEWTTYNLQAGITQQFANVCKFTQISMRDKENRIKEKK